MSGSSPDDIVLNILLSATNEASGPIAAVGTTATQSAREVESAAAQASAAMDQVMGASRASMAAAAAGMSQVAERTGALAGRLDQTATAAERTQGSLDTLRGTTGTAAAELSALADQSGRASTELSVIADTSLQAKMGLTSVGDEGEYAASMLARTSGAATELHTMLSALAGGFDSLAQQVTGFSGTLATVRGSLQGTADAGGLAQKTLADLQTELSPLTTRLGGTVTQSDFLARSFRGIADELMPLSSRLGGVRDRLMAEGDAASYAATQNDRLARAQGAVDTTGGGIGGITRRGGGFFGTPSGGDAVGRSIDRVGSAGEKIGTGAAVVGAASLYEFVTAQQQFEAAGNQAGLNQADINAIYARGLRLFGTNPITSTGDYATAYQRAAEEFHQGRGESPERYADRITQIVEESMRSAVASIAKGGNVALPGVAEALSKTEYNFGLNQAQSQHAMDILHLIGARGGNMSVGDLSEYLPKPAATGGMAGFSLPQTGALFDVLSSAYGPQQASTFLNGLLQHIVEQSKGARTDLRAMGLEKEFSLPGAEKYGPFKLLEDLQTRSAAYARTPDARRMGLTQGDILQAVVPARLGGLALEQLYQHGHLAAAEQGALALGGTLGHDASALGSGRHQGVYGITTTQYDEMMGLPGPEMKTAWDKVRKDLMAIGADLAPAAVRAANALDRLAGIADHFATKNPGAVTDIVGGGLALGGIGLGLKAGKTVVEGGVGVARLANFLTGGMLGKGAGLAGRSVGALADLLPFGGDAAAAGGVGGAEATGGALDATGVGLPVGLAIGIGAAVSGLGIHWYQTNAGFRQTAGQAGNASGVGLGWLGTHGGLAAGFLGDQFNHPNASGIGEAFSGLGGLFGHPTNPIAGDTALGVHQGGAFSDVQPGRFAAIGDALTAATRKVHDFLGILGNLPTGINTAVDGAESGLQRFGASTGQTFANLGTGIRSSLAQTGTDIGSFWSGVGTDTHAKLSAIGLDVGAFWQGLATTIHGDLATIGADTGTVFSLVGSTIHQKLASAASDIATMWNGAEALIHRVLATIGADVGGAFSAIGAGVSSHLSRIGADIQATFHGAQTWIGAADAAILGDVRGAWSAVSGTVGSWLSQIGTTIKTSFATYGATISGELGTIGAGLTSWFGGRLADLKSWIASWLAAGKTMLAGWLADLTSGLVTITSALGTWFSSELHRFESFGTDAMSRLVTGITGSAPHLKDALVSAIDQALQGAKDAAGSLASGIGSAIVAGIKSKLGGLLGGLGSHGGGGFAGSYASGPNNLSPSMATLGFNAPFYDSGQEASNYQMFGGLGIPYNGALLDWDYATSPHAVRLPPGQYRYGGQYSQAGMGTFEYFNTPNGGDIGFNHLQATPGFKPGQEVKGGATIGISGEPTSSQFGSGWHLCIVTDASGRAYLKWLTGADMENLSRGQAGGFAGGGGMSGAADPLQAHLGGPVTGHEPRGTSPVSVRVVESVPQMNLGSGRFAGTEALIKQQGYAPYVTNPDQAGTYFAREGSTDIPALAAELKRLPPEIAKPLASQLGKIAGEWDAAGRTFNTGLATEDTRHQQALQAIHDRYGNREQALLDKYQISDGTAKAGFLLHESANYAKAQEDQRHTLAKYNIDQSSGNETYLAKQSGIYSRASEEQRHLETEAAVSRRTEAAAERAGRSTDSAAQHAKRMSADAAAQARREEAIRHQETVSTQAIATLATTLGISQTKAKAILDEDLRHRQVVSQQAITTLAGELGISRKHAKAMLEEALKTSAGQEALANQKENESHQRHVAGLTQALENHVNSLHIKLSQLGKTIAADLDPSKLWGEVGQQLATNAQKYADTGSALEYALAQGQGKTETTYHPLTAAQRAANRQSEVNGGGPIYQPGAPTTTNLTAAELATVITSAITTRGQVDDRTLATDRFNASVDLGSGDLAAFGKDLADESSIISREGLQRALAGQSYSEQIDTLRALAAQQRTAQTSLDGWDAIVSASTGTLSDMEKAGQSLATDIQGTWERALLDGADGASQLQQQLVLAAQAEADVTTAKNLEAAYLGEITGSAAELDAGLKGLLSTASDKISFWTDMVGRAGTVASAAAGSIGQLATTAIAAAQNLGSLPDIIAGLKNTADQTLTAGETEFARTGQISPGTVSAFDAAHGAETGATADKSFADLAMYQSAGDITDYYKSLGEALPLLAQNVTDTANKFGTASTQYQQAEAAYQNASNEYAGLGTWIQNDGNLTKLHTVTVGESSSAIADNSAKYTQASAAIAAFQSGGITPAEAALKPLTVTIHSTDVTLGQVQTALTTVQGDLTVLGNDALAAGAALGTLASAALAAASGEGAAAAAAWQAAAAQGSDGSSGPGTMAAGQHIPGLAGVLYQAAANGTSAALGGTGATGPGTSVIGQTIPGLAGVLYQAGTTGTAALQFTAPTAATGSPAYAQGYEAGSNGQNPSTNPYPVTTQQGYDYAQGVQDGLTAYNSRGTQPTSPTGVAPQIPAVPTADTGTSVNGGTTGAPALTPVSPVDVQSAANIGGGAASAAGLDTTASVPALGTGAPRGATTTAKSVGATPFFAQHAAGPSADDLYAAEQHRLTGVPGTLTIMGHQFATINGVPQIPASLLTQVVNGQTQTMTGGQFVNGLLAQGSQFLSQYYSGGVSTALPAGANGSDATLGADGRYVAGASGTLSPAQMSWNAELANAAVNPGGLNGWSPVVGPQGPALFQPSTPGSKDGTLDQWGFPIYSPDGTGQYSGLSRGMMETATSDWPLGNLLGGGSYSQVAQQSQQTALLQQIASSTAATAASTGQMVTIGGFLVDNTNPADARERVMSYLQYMQQLFGQLKQLDAAQAGMQVGRSLDWEQMMAHIAGAGAIFGAVAINP